MAEEEKKKRKRVVVEEVAEDTESPSLVEPSPVVDEIKPSEENSAEIKDVDVVSDGNAQETPVETKVEVPQPEESASQKVVLPSPEYKEKKSFNLFFFFLILFFAFLITIFIGGIYVYLNGTRPAGPATVSPTATPTSSASPDATPSATAATSPTPAPTTIKISILNGSGKSGEAGKARALVEKAGFNVESTGNASAFNFTDTQIQVKAGVSAETVAKLKESLSGTYSVTDGKALDSKSQFDVVITVGSKVAQ